MDAQNVTDHHDDDLTPRQRRIGLGLLVVLVAALLVVGVVVDGVTTQSVSAAKARPPLAAAPFPGIVEDAFDRAAPKRGLGEAPTGQRWTQPAGRWGIADGAAALVAADPGRPSYALARVGRGPGSIQVTAAQMAKGMGLAFRCAGPLSCWTLTAVPEFGTWKVTKIVAGKPVDLGNLGTVPVDAGTIVRVDVSPESVAFWVNGQPAREIADGELKDNARAGLVVAEFGPDATSARFADFSSRQGNMLGAADATIRDAFERPNAASLGRTETGQAWRALRGTWGIRAEDAVLASKATRTPSIAIVDLGFADGVVQVTGTTVPEGFGAAFRCRDAHNCWRVVAVPGFGTWNVLKVVDGRQTLLGGIGLATFGPGSTITVRMQGPRLTFYVDGVETKTIEDADLADATGAGLVVASKKGRDARFAGFAAAPPPPENG